MATIKGYVIAGTKDNFYLHRSGNWVEYDSPAKAYVWTKEEVDSILKEFESIKEGIVPNRVIPATFVIPTGGLTTIDGAEISARDFGNTVKVSGNIFDAGSFNATYNLIAGSHSL